MHSDFETVYSFCQSFLQIMSPFLLILAIVPGLLICLLIFKIDKFEKEPVLHLSSCFLQGSNILLKFLHKTQMNEGWKTLILRKLCMHYS